MFSTEKCQEILDALLKGFEGDGRLACLRYGLEARHYRHAHQLPSEFQEALPPTLVSLTAEAELHRALQAPSDCLFTEALALDQKLNLNLSTPLQAYINQLLSTLRHQ
jgi:hypothetical protein